MASLKAGMGAVPDYDGMSVEEFDKLLWHVRARVVRRHDGDTFFALADQGWMNRVETGIRLADVWAPELWQPGGQVAKFSLDAILPAASLDGWPLRFVSHQLETKTEQDTSFTRAVGDAYIVINGVLRNVKGLL